MVPEGAEKAGRLVGNGKVQARIAGIQAVGAEKAGVMYIAFSPSPRIRGVREFHTLYVIVNR
jgi:hypothetical protein